MHFISTRSFWPSLLLGLGLQFALSGTASAQCAGSICTVASEGDLTTAINYANANANTTINISNGTTITLMSNMPILQGSGTVINGTGATLDGANTYRGFFIYSGSTAINGLTITQAVAKGGNGGSADGGGGGGLGAGSAVFVGSGAQVTVSGVQFTNGAATGGNGGDSSIANSGGGGGGFIGNGFNGGGGGGGLFGNAGSGTNGGGGGVTGRGGNGTIGGGGGTANGSNNSGNNGGNGGADLTHIREVMRIQNGAEQLSFGCQNTGGGEGRTPVPLPLTYTSSICA
ncbi:MAG: hypothetical protein PS018_27210 [bacterium]|nr:hypothetical protein [bacterium]